MSGTTLKDLNTLPISEKKSETPGKQSMTNPCVGVANKNDDKCQQKNCTTSVPECVNSNEATNNVGEICNSEVEYIESEKLNDVEDVDSILKALLTGLDSKDWVYVCESLNNVRRLSIFHKEAMLDMLGDIFPLIVKSLKNPRSAVCKTAIMTSADIIHAYSDNVIDLLDPMLVQLLLKASQDKRFVCEAAEKALVAMTTWVSPTELIPKLQPYLKNKNPRIRAKVSMCFSRSVPRLGVEGINSYGIDKLIQIAASQLSDQLPESREAARTLLLELQSVYEKSPEPTETTVTENSENSSVMESPENSSWEQFCQSKLSPLSAQAVLRVTNISREGLVLGS